jgi:hypothetical protein
MNVPALPHLRSIFSAAAGLTATFLATGCYETFRSSYEEDSRTATTIEGILAENEARVKNLGKDRSSIPTGTAKPTKGDTWWQSEVTSSLKEGPDKPITVDGLFVQDIQNSTQIKVFSDIPLIRETSIQEAKGEFDTVSFVEAMYSRTNDPIGNLLETGFESGRFLQDQVTAEAGLKKKLATGAEVKISQQMGVLSNKARPDSNSA